jgi:effector-binding domain-containing protein
MKTFKKVLIVIGAIIVLLVLISFFLPSTVKVERSIFINTHAEIPFEQANNFHLWDAWMPWNKIDTTMKKSYEGPESGVGSVYHWESNHPDVGVGSMKIIRVVKDSMVEMVLAFKGENREAKSAFVFENLKDSTKVTWYIIMQMGWNPVSKYFGLLMDAMMGDDFEQGLKDMKAVCETKPCCMKYKIEEVVAEPYYYLSIRDTCTHATISAKLGTYYGEIMAYMEKNGLKQTKPPISLNHSYENGVMDMETGIPVDKAPKTKDKRIMYTQLKGGKALVADYYGPYDKIDAAHEALMHKVEEAGLKISGACWEEYITDPGVEKDSSKWHTKIYYPVE